MQMLFENKVVVITGGGGGLAGALIDQLLLMGAKVAALDLAIDRLTPSDNLLPIRVDITDHNELQKAVDRVIEIYGGIDLLFNNAGITHMSRFNELSDQAFDTIMAVNFTAAVQITRMCLPWLVKRGGQIVAISSVAGFAPLYGRSAYSASKHAMEGFFSSLACEVADDGVGVLLVCPSFVKTRPELGMQSHEGLRSPGAMKRNTNGEQVSPQLAAQRILTATIKRKRRLHLGRVAKMAYWLHALLPGVYHQVMKKGAKQEFESV